MNSTLSLKDFFQSSSWKSMDFEARTNYSFIRAFTEYCEKENIQNNIYSEKEWKKIYQNHGWDGVWMK